MNRFRVVFRWERGGVTVTETEPVYLRADTFEDASIVAVGMRRLLAAGTIERFDSHHVAITAIGELSEKTCD